MKYDLDCIRAVLLHLEENLTISEIENGETNAYEHSEIWIQELCHKLNGFSSADIVYSVERLLEAKFIYADTNYDNGVLYTCRIFSISYEGHEFIEKIREPEQWAKVKGVASAVGNWAIQILSQIATNVALGLVDRYFPMSI